MFRFLRTVLLVFAAIILLCAFFFSFMVMDMSMEGLELCYPSIGYLVPGMVLFLVQLIITFIARKKQWLTHLKQIAIIFFGMLAFLAIFDHAFTLPAVSTYANAFGFACRLCAVGCWAVPLYWLIAKEKPAKKENK